jgi:hypothetical protein
VTVTDTLDTMPDTDTDTDLAVDPNAPREVTFDADRLERLTDELARLNKIAARLKVDPIKLEITGEGTREKKIDDPFRPGRSLTVDIPTLTATLTGASPRLPGGWEFLGSIEFLGGDGEENGKLVHGDDPRLAPYRAAGPDCDHCGFKRNRKKTVILVNEAGALTMVGSTCLKDFLGYHGDPEKVLRFFDDICDTLADLDDEGSERFGRAPDTLPTDALLPLAAATVRTFGWVAKSASFAGTPTANRVADFIWRPTRTKYNGEYLAELDSIEVTDVDEAKAKAAGAWVTEAAGDSPENNYLGNLKVILGGPWVERKHFGLAVSAIGAYDRAMGREVERKAKAEAAAVSEWVGTVKKREAFAGTVTGRHAYDSMYGTGYVIKIVDADGNLLKTMTSADWARHAEIGDELEFKATVKAHDTWNGGKETMLTRVALTKGGRDYRGHKIEA